ncbi:MAG: hypothetical protein VB055_07665 [Oscillospiraceae bacterium]|nr:hypothetical protein [Oscillospiraceae bacterium]
MGEFRFSDLHFSEAEIRKVFTSSEGKKLLQLLNQDGGQKLRQAAEALRNGQTETAQQILSPVMESDEASRLIEKLNQE